ncbi:hypothetical protein [Hymenobacter cellulosilyticus]|uniref:PEGA domain-containing protein n=1 Tax=Hymenobacter cellulosilyticus TaxID=2932248 RepID=A0A8T9QBA9_9BACT|nr:hypothetical protein [Hymenobacter cellulosilyticus]UOQ73418.1 hypothetical protein MUN79_05575 [Hymenobacter cellulosilyticus]
MKKALLLCFGLLVLLAADLKAAPANVNFSSERGIPFNLVFDGRALTRNGAREVHIDRLVPGYHWAEFFIPTGYGRSISYRTRVFLDPGLETTYVLVTRQGYPPVLRKVGAFPLRGGPRGGYGPAAATTRATTTVAAATTATTTTRMAAITVALPMAAIMARMGATAVTMIIHLQAAGSIRVVR